MNRTVTAARQAHVESAVYHQEAQQSSGELLRAADIKCQIAGLLNGPVVMQQLNKCMTGGSPAKKRKTPHSMVQSMVTKHCPMTKVNSMFMATLKEQAAALVSSG